MGIVDADGISWGWVSVCQMRIVLITILSIPLKGYFRGMFITTVDLLSTITCRLFFMFMWCKKNALVFKGGRGENLWGWKKR